MVVFLYPNLAWPGADVRKWKNDSQADFTAFSAFSDVLVGRSADADSLDLNVHDLAFPATTDSAKLAQQSADADPEQMTVDFSTYHYIDVLTRAQQNHGLPEFDGSQGLRSLSAYMLRVERLLPRVMPRSRTTEPGIRYPKLPIVSPSNNARQGHWKGGRRGVPGPSGRAGAGFLSLADRLT